ncbi:elongation factor P [Candidatus Falkowbacteria bacterium RIFOXYB2_FULL_34_18]|uniref:Elongation factor P n=1 Tax=Candidatus Falkowbacteria bacterium RIFOXYD2_FULL_34_120 TaxID=1798007 RepID=A0A1F5TQ62_9BACT|nr:MAG: elongation factor P [Candidatus Falkowbacteria bacterium RIFOXYB2_FULL_34_18]OGF29020.1 MAG: elongation factor P [Candidatus Falkowbacteria bacterium RIFOXYC12_FULL_34_55]OGF35963.1 MAG: elongation factor P [Candidatus Falkowbacteria bacterium RIFOXYC2_FULL_34_220]OGF38509.1 MAG: elongation factor P [Candidatus Falkowbacteria bacterium RIFOXYD12_FULL_34_57]OGF40671.1 MAG: elongation factor P [Candidatus Falkowbacteria bacterium RIFOXYD2_FULL_34_120]
MFSINEIKVGKVVQINNEPYLVVKTDHHKMGRGGAVLKTKLKNLINGSVLDKTFQGNDKVESANTEKKKANYMYKDEENVNLMDNETYEQFTLSLNQVGDKQKFLKEGTDVDILYFDGTPVAIDIPIKVELKVVSAPPGVKGNSAGNVNKQVELETGASISAPMFINEGDVIRINTETEEYVERV